MFIRQSFIVAAWTECPHDFKLGGHLERGWYYLLLVEFDNNFHHKRQPLTPQNWGIETSSAH